MACSPDSESAVLAEDAAAAEHAASPAQRSGGAPPATRALRSLAGVFIVTWAFRISGFVTFAT